MPDHKTFYELNLNQKLRNLKLIYKINAFVHAGIEKKHFDAAKTTDINVINKIMTHFYQELTFKNQKSMRYPMQRKIGSAVWLQWWYDYKRKGIEYCDKVYETLDPLQSYTMIVGHYFPSSEQKIFNDCNEV